LIGHTPWLQRRRIELNQVDALRDMRHANYCTQCNSWLTLRGISLPGTVEPGKPVWVQIKAVALIG